MTAINPLFVRVCDSQAVFGISRSTIYEMVGREEITIYKVGNKSLLKVSEIIQRIEHVGPSVGPPKT